MTFKQNRKAVGKGVRYVFVIANKSPDPVSVLISLFDNPPAAGGKNKEE
jgi:hypothetical protein